MKDTAIEWTDRTWNPTAGCSRISPGCENCYAERIAARFSKPGQAYHGLATMTPSGPRWTRAVRLEAHRLADPLRWRKPSRIFVDSTSDLFHEDQPNDAIAAVFGVMAAAHWHTFQVLTKRARRMREWFAWRGRNAVDLGDRQWDGTALRCWRDALEAWPPMRTSDWDRQFYGRAHVVGWPLPNVWLGVSVEDQQRADERIPELLKTPAAVRFLSCEPLLEQVELRNIDAERAGHEDAWWIDTLTGRHDDMGRPCPTLPRVGWVIAGCESGPGARPCEAAWLRSLRDQCAAAGVPFFLKQARGEVTDRACYPGTGAARVVTGDIAAGEGSKDKGKVIGAPYLDGVQHLAFPEAT